MQSLKPSFVAVVIALYGVGFALAQTAPQPQAAVAPLVRSVSYEQTTASGQTFLVIKVAVVQPSDPPCGGAQVTLDPLPLKNEDVSAPKGKARIVPEDKEPPKLQQGTFVYNLSVGENLDLPADWTDVNFGVTARCGSGTSAYVYSTPTIDIKRHTAQAAPLTINTSQPLWYQSQKKVDTVKLTLTSSRAIAISSVSIKDAVAPFNQISEALHDPVESTSHDFLFSQFSEHMKPSHKYTLALEISQVSPADVPPVSFNSLAESLKDYTISQIVNQGVLTVHDTGAGSSVSLEVKTNDSGSLTLTFDTLKIEGASSIPSSSDTDDHNFVIRTSGLDDGQYEFRFTGNRSTPPDPLVDSGGYTLTVDAVTKLLGPIGLKMQNGQISLAYCLSHKVNSAVAMYRPKTTSAFFTQPASFDTSGGACKSGTFAFTDVFDAAKFSQALSPAATAPAASGAAGNGTPPTEPIELHILDSTAPTNNQDVAVLDLDAVELGPDQSAALNKAVQDLQSKQTSSTVKDSASKTIETILQAAKVDPDTITAFEGFAKDQGKKGSAATTVGTVLGTVLKGVTRAYLGIPATPAK